MTLASSPYARAPVDMAKLCRNWRQTLEASDVRMGNKAAAVAALASAVNRVLGRYPRVWAAMGWPLAVTDTTGSAPLIVLRRFDGAPNGTSFDTRVMSMPRTAGAGNCYLSRTGGGSTPSNNWSVSAPDKWADLVIDTYETNRGARANALTVETIGTYNGFTLLDIVIQDAELRALNSALHDLADPALAKTGGAVLADLIKQIRFVFHRLRAHNLTMDGLWCAQASGGLWQTPGSTNPTAVVVTSATFVNLIDQTITARSATSFGHSSPARHCGTGPEDETAGQQVPVMCWVYAHATAGNGTVRFEGPLGHVDITVTGGPGVAWYGGVASKVNLDSSVSDTDITIARNKIDPMGKVASGTLYIYNWTLERTQ